MTDPRHDKEILSDNPSDNPSDKLEVGEAASAAPSKAQNAASEATQPAGKDETELRTQSNKGTKSDEKTKEEQRKKNINVKPKGKIAFNKKINMEFEEIFRGEEYPKYLTLTTEAKVGTIELEDYLMKVYPTEEMSFRKSKGNECEWIIHTTSKDQSEKYLGITKIKNIPTKVEAHQEMNSTWGTIALLQDEEGEEEEYFRILKGRNHKVEEMKIITIQRSNKKIAKIKFKGETLPPHIYFGGRRKQIKPYVPKPTQCYNCSKYGHYSKFCNKEETQCFYCAGSGHESKWKCGREEKCINCGENHHSRSDRCQIYQYNCKVKLLQERSGMTFRQAKDRLAELGIKDPRSQTTLAGVVKPKENKEENASEKTQEKERKEREQDSQQSDDHTNQQQNLQNKGREEINRNQKVTEATPTRNRFNALQDEAETEEKTEEGKDSEDEQDLLMLWDESRPQRSPREAHNSPTRGRKRDQRKRSREDSQRSKSDLSQSPKIEQQSKKTLTEPIKNQKPTEEQIGFKIPTITTIRERKERCPLGEEITPHPRKNEASTSRESSKERTGKGKKEISDDEISDLDGIKRSMEEYGKRKTKSQERSNRKHEGNCGCNECFWEEAQKIQKINEKKANELIELFIANKTSRYITDEEYHAANCCCVIHLRKKVKETKDNNKMIQNIITSVNAKCINKDKETNS